MTAKYNTGDIVTLSDEYFRQGSAYFGKHLRHQVANQMRVLKVHVPKDGEQDSLGNIVPVIYDVLLDNHVESFCEQFLKQVA